MAGRPRLAPVPATAEVIDRFRAALAARDIVPPAGIIADGSIHRCDAAGKNGKGDAAYLLHLDGIPAGGVENWRDGRGWESWRFDIGRALTPAELDALRIKAEAASARREDEAVRRHAAAREVAARIWHAARPASDEHPYLARKGVAPHGLRVVKGALVVPIRDAAGELHSLQFIGASGTKRFLKGGRVAGLYFLIGVAGKVTCIADGYATGASIHAATGYAVAVAFNAGNLGPVAGVIRENHPGGQIIVCADDDAGTDGNPGLTHARDAARATGALVAVPAFGADRPAGATDFNDLHRAHGLEAVRDSIAAAKAPAGGDVDTGGVATARGMEWADPEPLNAQPYPDEALPRILRDAVRQAQSFVQAPMALVGHAPVPPLVPRLLYADATPEALAHALATGWPSGGVLSAEAGAVFGAHGMGQDTILRNLALLNVLWDGGEMAINRRSKPSFVLRGRRLTFGLMVQPEALRGVLARAGALLERAGTLPRGTGFIARFLIAWPGVRRNPRRGLHRGLAFERSTALARRSGHTALARRGDPARCLAAQRSAGQRHRSRADEADLPVRSELRPGQPRPARRAVYPRRAWTGEDGGRRTSAGSGDQSSAAG